MQAKGFTPRLRATTRRNPSGSQNQPATASACRNAMTDQYLSVIDSGYLSRRPSGGERISLGTVAPLGVTVESGSVFLTSQASSRPSA